MAIAATPSYTRGSSGGNLSPADQAKVDNLPVDTNAALGALQTSIDTKASESYVNSQITANNNVIEEALPFPEGETEYTMAATHDIIYTNPVFSVGGITAVYTGMTIGQLVTEGTFFTVTISQPGPVLLKLTGTIQV